MKREPEWIEPFFAAFRQTGNARAAAATVSISHDTPYQHAWRHPDFQARWNVVRQETYHLFRGRNTAARLISYDRSIPIPSRTYDTAFDAIDAAEQAEALSWEEAIVLRARYRVKVMD